jgi:hypothetical protein
MNLRRILELVFVMIVGPTMSVGSLSGSFHEGVDSDFSFGCGVPVRSTGSIGRNG